MKLSFMFGFSLGTCYPKKSKNETEWPQAKRIGAGLMQRAWEIESESWEGKNIKIPRKWPKNGKFATK